jgi:hypothetical protein
MADETLIPLRIVCLTPPISETSAFGLQDRGTGLRSGQVREDGALVFECHVTVRPGREGQPDFVGAFVHGTPGSRFLYLSLRNSGGGEWIRRIKVPLIGIPWEYVDAAQGRALEATVDGARSGMAKLLNGGWRLTDQEGSRL